MSNFIGWIRVVRGSERPSNTRWVLVVLGRIMDAGEHINYGCCSEQCMNVIYDAVSGCLSETHTHAHIHREARAPCPHTHLCVHPLPRTANAEAACSSHSSSTASDTCLDVWGRTLAVIACCCVRLGASLCQPCLCRFCYR